MTIAAAAMDPVGSSNCEAPVKFAMAAGAVMERSVDVNEIANNRSFQQKMKTKMPRSDDAGRGQWSHHLPERLPRSRAVHLSRLFEFPRNLFEERGERVDRQRQRKGDVRQDESGPGVEESEPSFDVEQRAHQ